MQNVLVFNFTCNHGLMADGEHKWKIQYIQL